MKEKPYFTLREVTLHNTVDDLWVVFFGKVLDLTPLCQMYKDDPGLFPLIAFGGKDISHLFDDQKEVKYHLNPVTGKIDTFMPFKSLIGAATQSETEKLFEDRKEQDLQLAEAVLRRYTSQRLDGINFRGETMDLEPPKLLRKSVPWWKDEQYVIGYLTRKARWINIRNVFIRRNVRIEVCSEDTIDVILERYLKFNSHARGYVWKYLGEELAMGETLENNGIPDLDEKMERLRLNKEDYYPTIDLFFNDHHTEI